MSFLSAVAGGGIALGVGALVLSLAALSGFQDVLIREVLARSPMAEIELPAASGEAELAAALEAVRAAPGVRAARLVLHGTGWLLTTADNGSLVRPVELVGFEGEVPASFPGAAGAPEGLYVDAAVATSWGLETGETLRVVSPHPTLVPFGPPQPRLRSLPLAGTFEHPRTQQETTRAALPLSVARTLFPGRVPAIEVDAESDAALALPRRLEGKLPAGATVRTWRDLNRSLFFVLRLEKAMMFTAVSLIVLVAALALVADLSLIVAAKRSEIGILGAMGASPKALTRAFLWLGGLLAGIGATVGLTAGVGASWALDRWQVVKLPADVYVFDHVPFSVRPFDVGAVLVLTLALAAVFSLYAARRAASLDPIEAMRR